MTSTPPPPPPPPPSPVPAETGPRRPVNRPARIAFIIAVVAFVLGVIPFVGFISWLVAAAAIVFAIVALARPGLPKGMAVAGLIIGVIALFVGPSVAIASVIGAAAPAIEAAASSAAAVPDAPSVAPQDNSTPSEDAVTPTSEPSDETVPTKTYPGSGDKVIKVDYERPVVVKFSCATCSDNVSVETDSGTNTLPVNTIGHYTGRFLLNAEDGDLLTKFVIKATGRWKLTVTDLQNATLDHVTAGSKVAGDGDDVIAVDSGVSDADVRNVGSGNFALQSYGGSDSLPVNEIGSYQGDVELDGPAVVQVQSDGTWSIKGNG